ncbi:MAG: alpha/beta hydrolase [Bdellovibrionales bacterium]|nr:alpha/beta hydrolase [Bdellovibrionales bacterium]
MRARLFSLPLLLCGCGALYTARVEERFPPIGEMIATESGPIHYTRAGTGPTVVFVHGLNGSLRDLTDSRLYPMLVERFDVIAFDRPGSGYSSRGRFEEMSPQEHAHVLRNFLRALDVQRPLLIGHSAGGAVCLAYAVEYQQDVAGLLLLGAVAYPWPGSHSFPLQWFAQLPLAGDLFMQTAFVPLALLFRHQKFAESFGTNPIPSAYYEPTAALSIRPKQYLRNAQDLLLLWDSVRRLSERYRKLDLPITLLHGRDDDTVPARFHAERLAAEVPDAKLVLLSGISHQPHHTAPEAVLRELMKLEIRAEQKNRRHPDSAADD